MGILFLFEPLAGLENCRTAIAVYAIIVVYLNLFLYLCSRFTSKVWNKAD